MIPLTPVTLALSIAGEGIMTMVIPLAALIGVFIWYFVLLRRSRSD